MSRSPSPNLTIVIPARNEARNLELVLPELPAAHEVILVDGGSVDGTVDVAQRLLPDIRVVHQTRRGKGNALACGFLAATGDIIVMFDADGSADPAEIPAFVEALVNGADIAKGTRYHPEHPHQAGSEDLTWLRDKGNQLLNAASNTLFRTSFSDLCYGYNAFWRDIVPVLDLPAPELTAPDGEMIWCDGFEIETVISCRVVAAGLKVTEVPSVERSRIHGESNLRTFRDGFRVLRTILAEWRRAHRLRQAARHRATADPAGPASPAEPTHSTPATPAGPATPAEPTHSTPAAHSGPTPAAHTRPTPAEHSGPTPTEPTRPTPAENTRPASAASAGGNASAARPPSERSGQPEPVDADAPRPVPDEALR